jgi:hypothetical protein
MANSSIESIMNRKWRTSVISPFAANVVFSLYQCPSNTWKIRTLVNEVEMQLPGCDSTYCPLEQFLAQYNTPLQCPYCTMCYSVDSLQAEDACVCPMANKRK